MIIDQEKPQATNFVNVNIDDLSLTGKQQAGSTTGKQSYTGSIYEQKFQDLKKARSITPNEYDNRLVKQLGQLNSTRQQENLNYNQQINMNVSAMQDFDQDAFHDREKSQLLENQIKKDIQQLANSKKISDNSYRIIVKKLEQTLAQHIMQIDKQNSKLLTFEQLGRLLSLLGLFQIIQFDENNKLVSEKFSNSQEELIKKQRKQDLILHEQFWMLLQNYESQKQQILLELAYSTLRILLDPVPLSAKEIGDLLAEIYGMNHDSFKENYEKRKSDYQEIIPWPLDKFIVEFRKLNANRIAREKIHKPKKEKPVDEYVLEQQKQLTFKPALNSTSLYLDAQHTEKFLQQNPPDWKYPEPLSKDQYESLLFENKLEQPASSQEQQEPKHQLVRSKTNDNLLDKSPRNNRIWILLKKQEQRDKWIEEQKKQKEQEEKKECTFHPQVINPAQTSNVQQTVTRLYNENLEKLKQKNEELQKQREQEKEEQDKKNLTFQPNTNTVPTYLNKAQQKQVKGFEKNVGRMLHAQEINEKKKQQLEHQPAGEGYEKRKNEKFHPPQMVDRQKKVKKAFLVLDINVPNGKKGRIGLHEDDDPKQVAKNFAKTFMLNDEMEETILDILNEQYNKYRSRTQSQINPDQSNEFQEDNENYDENDQNFTYQFQSNQSTYQQNIYFPQQQYQNLQNKQQSSIQLLG